MQLLAVSSVQQQTVTAALCEQTSSFLLGHDPEALTGRLCHFVPGPPDSFPPDIITTRRWCSWETKGSKTNDGVTPRLKHTAASLFFYWSSFTASSRDVEMLSRRHKAGFYLWVWTWRTCWRREAEQQVADDRVRATPTELRVSKQGGWITLSGFMCWALWENKKKCAQVDK